MIYKLGTAVAAGMTAALLCAGGAGAYTFAPDNPSTNPQCEKSTPSQDQNGHAQPGTQQNGTSGPLDGMLDSGSSGGPVAAPGGTSPKTQECEDQQSNQGDLGNGNGNGNGNGKQSTPEGNGSTPQDPGTGNGTSQGAGNGDTRTNPGASNGAQTDSDRSGVPDRDGDN
ncbi:hypothetical protein F5X71_26755 [Nocardia brasiliensis]|uniref:Uncharacterized protein n=1 Tax=Nocardia brasiliensis TaxID=37326 RepID=A0A6G9XX77_NOCBR|nr:hypothetical protein [Nocardia brasiliensis]QIS05433.1 hypothetical protein F5X71_26755 [Nocardia brasiliensis]